MSKDFVVQFLGGDIKGQGGYGDHVFVLPKPGGGLERVHVGCCRVEQIGAENSKSFGGAAAAGVAGGLLLGPAGLLAGALVGGNKNLVSFTVEIDDGRRTVGQAHPSLFAKIIADGFTATCVALDQPRPGDGTKGCLGAAVLIVVFSLLIAALVRTITG